MTLPDLPSILISALSIPRPSVPVLELTTATLQLNPVVEVAKVVHEVDVTTVPLYEFAAKAVEVVPTIATTSKAIKIIALALLFLVVVKIDSFLRISSMTKAKTRNCYSVKF